MDQSQFKKRILDTEWDIYPLEKLLPLETVYGIFKDEYSKSEDRNLFFRDRKFQRLREGYFAIFVAISLQDVSEKTHFLFFPKIHDNDVDIIYRSNNESEESTEMSGYRFDVKEYTNWSTNFEEFMKNSIIPKIGIYNITVATYREMNGQDLGILVSYLKEKDFSSKIWILSLPSGEIEDYSISQVTVINKEGIIYNETINLNDWMQKEPVSMVFQDVIRYK